MGEVYRARDPRLNRQVAIKILARAGADPVRQRRLLDEAQAASALNHPNIITVYDVGTDDGMPFIVSELVEGASLRELVARGPLPIRDVLELGVQMAEGLAAAHQAGIVHRDFKPENVMVTRDGRVKILDFGLAIMGPRDGSTGTEAEETLSVVLIAGTVPYMSPEQARGAGVDFRTDQFSLGLTLYEMVSGRRAFAAESTAQTLASIIDDEPEPIAKLNPRAPAPLRWLIERCLTKDPRQRYDSTTDLARELRTLRDRVGEFTPAGELMPPAAPPLRRRVLLIAASVALAAALGLFAATAAGTGDDRTLEHYRFTPVATDAGYQASPAWSPDGKTLAYIAGVNGVLQVFTRVPGSAGRAQITRERFDCRDPFWSPDGTRIYYMSLVRDREGLKSISTAGGESDPVVEDVFRATLSPNGKTLAFFRDQGTGRLTLHLASPPGSPPVEYTQRPYSDDRGDVEATLHFSPDSSKLGVWVERGQTSANLLRAEFWVVPMNGAAPRRAFAPSDAAVGLAPEFSWLPDSRRIVSALPSPEPGVHLWLMDTEGGDTRLLTATGGREDEPAISLEGRLALTLQDANYDMYELSAEHPAPVPALTTSRNEMDPASSPDGTAMAFTTDRSGRGEIWMRSRDGVETPLVTPDDFGASRTYLLSAPAFDPGGQRIAFNRSGSEGMQIWIRAIASGPPTRLAPTARAQDWPTWSADGDWVAFAQAAADPTWSLMKARIGGRMPPEELVKHIVPFSPVQWSPKGAWIAYNSSSGLAIVAPDGKSSRVVSDQEWIAFTWSADDQRLYGIRLSDDYQHLTFTSVDVRSGTERVLGPDFMTLPVAGRMVRGITRTGPSTFLASIVQVRSDVWLLEGFLRPQTLWERLARLASPGRR